MSSRLRCVVIVGLACACSGERRKVDDGWTRTEWLQAVRGFATQPSTMPRLDGDAQSRALFAKIVTNRAWLALDRSMFTTDPELLQFFPTMKQLEVTLIAQQAVDELVAVQLFSVDVSRAFVFAGLDYVRHLPEGDTSRENRLHGLQGVRTAAAADICGVLLVSLGASEGARAAALAKLSEPYSYDFLTRSPLQLILATLDEQVLPAAGKGMRPAYRKVRDAVAKLHELAPANESRITYEGLTPAWNAPRPTRFTSHSGHFSVETYAMTLVKRVEIPHPDGTTEVQHWITSQVGDTSYEAVCSDGASAAEIVAKIRKQPGMLAAESKFPGFFFVNDAGPRDESVRIIDIGGRGCLLDVAGPNGKLDHDVSDAFLLSIQQER